MAYQLGYPSYSYQYNNGGTRTISGLNLKTSENDDGITPIQFQEFMMTVFNALNVNIYLSAIEPKIISNRVINTVTGGE